MSSSGNVASPTCADGDDIAAGAEEDEVESGTVSVAAAASCRILKRVVGVESAIMTRKQQSKQVNPSSQFCVGDGQLSFSRISRRVRGVAAHKADVQTRRSAGTLTDDDSP
jgi:hypothetical protein